jgi:GH43 family beta-xylosidase
MVRRVAPLLVAMLALASMVAVSGLEATAASAVVGPTFKNPVIRSGPGSDERVFFVGGMYYMMENSGLGGAIWAYSAATLTGLDNGTKTKVWTPPNCGSDPSTNAPNACDIWQPELQFVGTHWYVYYAADSGSDGNDINLNHRIFALQGGTDANDPLGAPFTDIGAVVHMPNRHAIDPTILHKTNSCGSDPAGDYLIWASYNPSNAKEELRIALLTTPTDIGSASSAVTFSSPADASTHGWESASDYSIPINEGPEVVKHSGRINVLFSGGEIWSDTYAEGLISNTGGCVRTPSNWTKDSGNPIFSAANGVHAVGTVGVVPSPDGTETWMMYQGEDSTNEHTLRVKAISWNSDNTPDLGAPDSTSTALAIPSGEIEPWGWGNAPATGGCSALPATCQVDGTWSFTNPTTGSVNSVDGTTYQKVFMPSPSYTKYSVSVNLRYGGTTGGVSSAPWYGVYGWYADRNNWMQARISWTADFLVTYGLVGGVSQGFQSQALPGGFSRTAFHNLRVVKRQSSGHGVFDVYLDDVKQTAVSDQDYGSGANVAGVVGLATEDQYADYTNFQLVQNQNPWGWGDIPNGGIHIGDWSLSQYTATSDPTFGHLGGLCGFTPEASTFQSNLSLVNYTLSTWVKRNSILGCGSGTYGIRAFQRDNYPRVNLFEASFDPDNDQLLVTVMVNGTDLSPSPIPLGSLGLTYSSLVELDVTKSSGTFTVSVAGHNEYSTTIASLSTVAGSFGLVANLSDDTFGSSATKPALLVT